MEFLPFVLPAILVICVYLLARNYWVAARRRELIDYHYSSVSNGRWRADFDTCYGDYDSWLFAWSWNPSKLSGVDWDEVKRETPRRVGA